MGPGGADKLGFGLSMLALGGLVVVTMGWVSWNRKTRDQGRSRSSWIVFYVAMALNLCATLAIFIIAPREPPPTKPQLPPTLGWIALAPFLLLLMIVLPFLLAPWRRGRGPATTNTKKVRIWSTPASAARGQLSLAAVIESFLSASTVILLAIRFGITRPLVFSVWVSPFLLLRTPASVRNGLIWLVRWYYISKRFPISSRTLIFCLGAIPIRIITTTKAFLASPLKSLENVPQNWFQLTFCTDIAHPPELVGGIETAEPQLAFDLELTRFRPTSTVNPIGRPNLEWTFYGARLVLFYIAYLPAIIWRLSFKASTLIYLPFVYMAHRASRPAQDFVQQLHDIKGLEIERLRRVLAWIVVVFQTILPLTIGAELKHLEAGINSVFARNLIEYYFVVDEIKAWHGARFIIAAITLGIYYLADLLLHRPSHFPDPQQTKRRLLNLILAVRALLSLYVIFCGFYFFLPVLEVVRHSHWRWLPW
jgi:hypothetical protein